MKDLFGDIAERAIAMLIPNVRFKPKSVIIRSKQRITLKELKALVN